MIHYNPNTPVLQLFIADPFQSFRDQANQDYADYCRELPNWEPFKPGSNWSKFLVHMSYVLPFKPNYLIKYYSPGVYKTLWFDTEIPLDEWNGTAYD